MYAYITQVCRLFDKDIHRFSIYSKFLYTMLPKGHGGEKINIDDKVLLEYYKLEKDFEGPIELESTEGGYTPISGDSGHREPKKDPLTVIIDKINEKYGTHFTEMDKVLVQMEMIMPIRRSGRATQRTMTGQPLCCCLKRIFRIWQQTDMSRMTSFQKTI